ncbi:MAG: hypothetical protein P9X26_07080, partial [Candidatus Stygibacter frigidus]|nr:hypothetical protein [Candidatus Stygibacter frigidus]
NEKNQLKITELPKKQRKIAKLIKSSAAAEELSSLMKSFPEDRKELIKIPQEVMAKLTELNN